MDDQTFKKVGEELDLSIKAIATQYNLSSYAVSFVYMDADDPWPGYHNSASIPSDEHGAMLFAVIAQAAERSNTELHNRSIEPLNP